MKGHPPPAACPLTLADVRRDGRCTQNRRPMTSATAMDGPDVSHGPSRARAKLEASVELLRSRKTEGADWLLYAPAFEPYVADKLDELWTEGWRPHGPGWTNDFLEGVVTPRLLTGSVAGQEVTRLSSLWMDLVVECPNALFWPDHRRPFKHRLESILQARAVYLATSAPRVPVIEGQTLITPEASTSEPAGNFEYKTRRASAQIDSKLAAHRLDDFLRTYPAGQTAFAVQAGTTDRTIRSFRKTGRVKREILARIAEAMKRTLEDLLLP